MNGPEVSQLVLAMLAFLASHAIPARPRLRSAGIRALGTVGYHLAYSALSIAVILWLAVAYGQAPYDPLWEQQPWMRWLPPLAMAPACLLLVTALSAPNPFSLGIGGRGFDPERPGILRLTRHPLLWALVLWAASHIVPNGDVASLILFGPLLLLALAGPPLMERKRRRDLGPETFASLARNTRAPRRRLLREIGAVRLGAAAVLYAALLHLHPSVIGISPLP